MREQAQINKKAWEYGAYAFWNQQATPEEKARYILKDPKARLKMHQQYFTHIEGKRIANICGSNGRIAVPLALLGAEVTVFDISEENRRYALELAQAAGVSIGFEVTDILEIDKAQYGEAFDMLYAEGGILHYFSEIDKFMEALYALTKPGGQLILSDFHPYRKVNPSGSPMMSVPATEGDYFDSRIHEGDVAYAGLYQDEDRNAFPKCSLRYYTLSEIINGVIQAGFVLSEFVEHPNYEDAKLPGFFTVIGAKSRI